MPDKKTYEWLDAKAKEFAQRDVAWERDERRHAGQDHVLDANELTRFDNEEADGAHYKGRKAEAVYINLPQKHASLVTGHLSKHRPSPGQGIDFGSLGEVRTRDEIDTPTLAELFYYNIDGIGNDGSSWESWTDYLDELAQVYGHMWVMVESSETAPVSYQDVLNGARSFAVLYTPREVPNWYYVNGVLQFAVIRATTEPPKLVGAVMQEQVQPGYYLLVRKGYAGFGEEFVGGGYWIFNDKRELLEGKQGTWENTKGEIPLFRHYGRIARGTLAKPRSSASDTMELGQLAIEMMNTRSARKFDFWDACASKIFILGATPEVMETVVKTYKESQLVAVPQAIDEDTGEKKTPGIYDGSTGTVSADVADKLELSQWAVANRLSIEKVTQPGESGAAKDAGFAEMSAPDLVRRIELREQTENTLLLFFALRSGKVPDGASIWQRDIQLTPLVDEIDLMFDTLKTAGVESDVLSIEMIMTAIEERGIVQDQALLKKIRADLEAKVAAKAAQAEADRLAFRAGVGNRVPTKINTKKNPDGSFDTSIQDQPPTGA